MSNTVRCSPASHPLSGHSARHRRGGFNVLWLGLIGGFLQVNGRIAQAQSDFPATRLTISSGERAAGALNPKAGEYPLDSVSEAIVTVPPQCEGSRRCPMFVFFPTNGPLAATEMLSPVAKKYGMILFVPSSEVVSHASAMDVAMREVFRRFAVDTEKVAVIGRCATGPWGMHYGMSNLDVFSRIVAISGTEFGKPHIDIDPKDKAVDFLLDAGFPESQSNYMIAREARQAGYRVTFSVGFRNHDDQAEDYDYLGHWLQQSWAIPDPTKRPAPRVVADPLPLLTPEVVTSMTAFWNAFMGQPDSIQTAARQSHLREAVMPIGSERAVVWMTDMPALAAQYPSVAAALKKAGLTAQQHDAYRLALLAAATAQTFGQGDMHVEIVDPDPTLEKNIAFINAHADELAALEGTGMWSTP